jgi:malate dehydrogenase
MSRDKNMMSEKEPIRIAVSGAAGRIAYSLVFRIAGGSLFGRDQPVALSLLELPEGFRGLQALEMELKDCAFPRLVDLKIGVDPCRAFERADWIILLGGKPFRSEVTDRLDLLRENAPGMIDHGRAINQVAPQARILVVAHPCNTTCLIAAAQAPNVKPENWFALNHVIRSRAVAMIAEKTGVPAAKISRLIVWGNNSPGAYIGLQTARVGARDAIDAVDDPAWLNGVLRPALAIRESQIFKLNKTTPAGSVAQSILDTIRAITTPAGPDGWFGAGVVSDGSYGVPRGLVFGFPLVTRDGSSWSIVDGIPLEGAAREEIARNVAELELEASTVSHLLQPV